MAAEKIALRLPKLKFCVTTDQQVRKGLENALFYKYVAPEEGETSGSLKVVNSAIFSSYESPAK